MTQAPVDPTLDAATVQASGASSTDILDVARAQVLERGEPLDRDQVLEVLRLPDERLT